MKIFDIVNNVFDSVTAYEQNFVVVFVQKQHECFAAMSYVVHDHFMNTVTLIYTMLCMCLCTELDVYCRFEFEHTIPLFFLV